MTQQIYMTDEVKLGKKGQVTLPRKMRELNKFKEDDRFIVTNMPGGEIILRKKLIRTTEDMMLDALDKVPDFDFDKAWKEVLEERKREIS